MELFDFALRSATIALLAVIIIVLWRSPIERSGRNAAALVALSTTALLIVKSLTPLNLPEWAMANLHLIGALEPLAITWLILAIFVDKPRYFWAWMASGGVASVSFFAHLQMGISPVICCTIGLIHHGALMGLAVWAARDDLVTHRCTLRPFFAVAIAGLAIGMIGMEALNQQPGHITATMALAQSIGSFVVVAAFGIWILRADTELWPGRVDAMPEPAEKPVTFAPDGPLLTRLQALMAEGIWREEGLTIGGLATRLGMPEHRLRRAINQGLGFRNFSSFINAARIEAAKEILSDPEREAVTVLEIAYQVGFASLGPFNRAFRAETGCAPTEFRRDALDAAAEGLAPAPRPMKKDATKKDATAPADSSKDAPIAQNLH
ncbi:MAG: helix-turn-helix domain-containing protein [Pseudomonadota bacterium]